MNFFYGIVNNVQFTMFILETGKVGGTFKENEKLKKEVRRLEEENNLLKLKFDVLLDMVILYLVFLKKLISKNKSFIYEISYSNTLIVTLLILL